MFILFSNGSDIILTQFYPCLFSPCHAHLLPYFTLDLVKIREQQLERVAQELDEINNEYIKVRTVGVKCTATATIKHSAWLNNLMTTLSQKQNDMVSVMEDLEKYRGRVIELQVDLNRERRVNKDLEMRLWVRQRVMLKGLKGESFDRKVASFLSVLIQYTVNPDTPSPVFP